VKLPGGERAIVDIAKLRDYCLNSAHPRGRHKARVFASTLGIGAREADLLARNLLNAALSEEAIATETDQYGTRYSIDFELVHNGRRALIRSGWIIRARMDVPRLLTCFVVLR